MQITRVTESVATDCSGSSALRSRYVNIIMLLHNVMVAFYACMLNHSYGNA